MIIQICVPGNRDFVLWLLSAALILTVFILSFTYYCLTNYNKKRNLTF